VKRDVSIFRAEVHSDFTQKNIIGVVTAMKILNLTFLTLFQNSHLISRNSKKPHTFKETLVLPTCTNMYKIMNCENYGQTLKSIHLINNTAMRYDEMNKGQTKEKS
jgi:hypothetical protein